MTDFNQLAEARIAEAVRRRFGEEIQVPTVAPELALAWTVGSDAPEDRILIGKTPWHTSRAVAAIAGNFTDVGVNSFNNTIVSVVTKVMIINATAGVLTYKLGGVQTAANTAFSRVASRDLRRLSLSTIAFDGSSAVDQLPSVAAFPVAANTAFVIDLVGSEWMTFANSIMSLVVQSGLVNQPVAAYFWGYERSLRPEEIKLD